MWTSTCTYHRSFGEKEGFSGQQQRPKYDKGLDNFEPRMIRLQKK